MSDVQGKSFGVQNDPLGQNKKIGLWKKIKNAFLGVKFAPQNRYFSVFLKMLKSGHFVLQISPWKLRRQKKLSTPWQSQRKILWNYHLRFLNFETLSQRYFTTKFLIISIKTWQTNILRKILSSSIFLQRQENFVKFFCQSYLIYQNVRTFMVFILTYWYWKSVESFKSSDRFFKDLQNWRFCGNFWVNRIFCSA